MTELEDKIYKAAMEAIAAAGSRDPRAAADFLGILPVDISGTILGYAALYNDRYPAIGINTRLDPVWQMFGGWHEIAHVLYGDVYDRALQKRGIFDCGFFMQEVDSKTIARHERRANLLSADVCLSDDDVARVTGYDAPLMQSYREVTACQEKLVHACEQLRFSICRDEAGAPVLGRLKAYQADLRKLEEKKKDLQLEMLSMNSCLSFSEMAARLGTTETILRYKLEAMRLRGRDIDPQELERYDQVFKGALSS